MTALEFIASVAWPVTVLAIAVMFRDPITEALSGATGRLRAGPFELEWERGVSTVESDLGLPPSISKGQIGGAAGRLDELAEKSPAGAIAEAYGAIESSLRSLLAEQGSEPDRDWGVMQLARAAHEQGLTTAETLRAIEGLDVLRNLAVHGRPEDLSPQRAHKFVALTQGVLYAMSTGA